MALRSRAQLFGLALMLPALFALPGDLAPSAATSAAAQASEKPILLTDPVPDPHQAGVQWFAPTGHTLRGAFLTYWNRYGGLAQFGYPLTEEFYEPVGPDGKPYLVQYFERNRFELHPENAGTPYEVLLGTLGREFHSQDRPARRLPEPATYFPETGHNLSGVFKAYWEGHGGLFVHGYPITEQFEEQSPTDHKMYLVQYFERSRFEWHPENAGSQYEMLLGLLGRQLSEKKGYPYGWYPLYGRAGDWSWVAGLVKVHMPAACATEWCPCSILVYDAAAANTPWDDFGAYRVQMGGQDWHQSDVWPQVKARALLVVFGNPEQAQHRVVGFCLLDPEAPAYLVRRVQTNPAE